MPSRIVPDSDGSTPSAVYPWQPALPGCSCRGVGTMVTDELPGLASATKHVLTRWSDPAAMLRPGTITPKGVPFRTSTNGLPSPSTSVAPLSPALASTRARSASANWSGRLLLSVSSTGAAAHRRHVEAKIAATVCFKGKDISAAPQVGTAPVRHRVLPHRKREDRGMCRWRAWDPPGNARTMTSNARNGALVRSGWWRGPWTP